MVDVARDSGATDYCVTVRPNWAVRGDGRCAALAVAIPVCSLVSIVCVLAGAWPVAPFFLAAMVGLGWAFQRVRSHTGDFERLTLHDGRLCIERHILDRDQRYEFNSAWVQLVGGDALGSNLVLRAHGCEVAFGTLLTEEERAAIATELHQRIGGAVA